MNGMKLNMAPALWCTWWSWYIRSVNN